jgi:uncharacterized protein YceK
MLDLSRFRALCFFLVAIVGVLELPFSGILDTNLWLPSAIF